MKRLFPALLAALMLLPTGCAGGGSAVPTAGPAPSDTPSQATPEPSGPAPTPAPLPPARLLYQGHGSVRIVTGEGKVIYIDPYAGGGYDRTADLILVTHGHADHTAVDLITTKSPDCRTITYQEALVNGAYKTYDLGYVTVEAVQAGNNKNHDINVCVGYVLTLSDGTSVYLSGDTSTTDQMAQLGERGLDYAFFCCDGKFNMDLDEAARCADLVGAKHSVPYHMAPGKDFDQARAERFQAQNRLILEAGAEIEL